MVSFVDPFKEYFRFFAGQPQTCFAHHFRRDLLEPVGTTKIHVKEAHFELLQGAPSTAGMPGKDATAVWTAWDQRVSTHPTDQLQSCG